MKALRQGETVPRIMRALDQNNASAAIIKSSDWEAAENLARFLNQGDKIRLLDAFVAEEGGGYRSDQSRGGELIHQTGPFFARQDEDAEEDPVLAKVREMVGRKPESLRERLAGPTDNVKDTG